MKPETATVFILMATFNGMRYLSDQIDSILAQSDPDWILLIRDDGSDEQTLEYLSVLAAREHRVELLLEPRKRLGCCGNFARLMQHALNRNARYFALCDQDDIWHRDKIRLLRTSLRQVEARMGPQAPVLVWSDLRWIDVDGRELASSHFLASAAAKAMKGTGRWALAMNVVPGCAMAGNNMLLRRALPLPQSVHHHDWWLLVVAATVGSCAVVQEALVDYRQHAGNLIGARRPLERARELVCAPRSALRRAVMTYRESISLASALRSRLVGSDEALRSVALCNHMVDELGARSAWRRVTAVIRGPVRRIGIGRNILMLVAALSRRCLP